jgi:hypothetical protein
MQTAYEEILDFVTSAPTLRQIVEFTHSEATRERVNFLMAEDESGFLMPSEREELREFQKAVYFIDQLKIRAMRRLEVPQAPSHPDTGL